MRFSIIIFLVSFCGCVVLTSSGRGAPDRPEMKALRQEASNEPSEIYLDEAISKQKKQMQAEDPNFKSFQEREKKKP